MTRPTAIRHVQPAQPATAEPAPDPLTLTWEGAAKRLGMSRYTLSLLVNAGEIRPIRVGGAVRFAVRELERWVDDATGQTYEGRR